LEKKIIVFGAGGNGEKVLIRLGAENVAFFCDNYKTGSFHEKKIINFSELVSLRQNLEMDIIVSISDRTVRNQLNSAGIPYWEVKDFFNSENMKKILDEKLFNQYLKSGFYDGSLDKDKNWFRTSFISDKNERLVTAMKNRKNKEVSKILSETYDGINEKDIYEDEYFENRPGMRLISSIIRQENRKIRVCDLACGHGLFLAALQSRTISCYGVDVSSVRCRAVNMNGIECKSGGAENSGYKNEMFDYVTIMECLEHVQNPFSVMEEAKRILKENGSVLVTVPYGTNCDSDMHVRQFYEDDLYSVAEKCGFKNIKIMKLPYLNYTYDDNLLMCAKK